MSDKIDNTISKFKEFQKMLLDNDTSPNMIYLKTEDLISDFHECSKIIEDKFVDISKKLTEHMNTGRYQK